MKLSFLKSMLVFGSLLLCYNYANASSDGGTYQGGDATAPAPSWSEVNNANFQMKSYQKVYSGASTATTTSDAENTFSGGADMLPANPTTVYNNSVNSKTAAMPLGKQEMPMDDGSRALSLSEAFGGDAGKRIEYARDSLNPSVDVIAKTGTDKASSEELSDDQVQNWVAKEGLTLREVLDEWAAQTGWEVIWQTNREYPLKASAIFRGRFKDVTAALVKGFSKAFPPPYAKFYMGNKVLVIKTLGDDNG